MGMTYPELSVIGVDPGGTTGWARFVVPRKCMYGDKPPEVLDFTYGELYGPEPEQVRDLCRLARAAQGLSYKVGPAVIVEDFDVVPDVSTTDGEVLLSPVRIAAMLFYAQFRGDMSDGLVTLQPRSLAKQVMTDERLRSRGYWIEGSEHIRDAVRHALTALRRAREKTAFRDEIWKRAP